MATNVAPPTAGSAPQGRVSFYRGGEGMFTWVLHRVTGVALFTFLFAHVLDTSLVIVGDGSLYNGVMEVYHHPLIKLMEIGLVVALIYHAVNGMRVMLIDFWAKGSPNNRKMMRVQWVVFTVLTLGAVIPMTAQLLVDL
jgi:succinate dehydrogenase / fumarate reductase, cytochrome b subunit